MGADDDRRARSRSRLPFGRRDSVVLQAKSRHDGLLISVVARRGAASLHAYLHTPGWGRILAVGLAPTAQEAAERADALLDAAIARGLTIGRVKPSRRASMPPDDAST